MKKITLNLHYSIFQIVPWSSFGVVLGYAGSFCLNRGMSDAQFGIMLAIISAATFGLQLLLAELISRIPRLNPQNSMLWIGILMLLPCIAMSFLPLSNPWMIGLLAFVCLLFQIIPSLANALAVNAMHHDIDINFGFSRGMGSVCYAIFAFLTGQLIARTNTLAVPKVELFLAILLIIGALTFPKVDKVQEEKTSGSSHLLRDVRFLLLLLGSTLLFACHEGMSCFVYQIIVSRGGTEAQQGIANFIGAICELPAMFLFFLFLKKGRCDTWLKISGFFVAGKALIYLFATECGMIYLAQLTHLPGFSLFLVSSVFYVGSITPKKDVVRSQALLAATNPLGKLLVSLCGSVLLEYMGVQGFLVCTLCMGSVGALILLCSLKKVEKTIGS